MQAATAVRRDYPAGPTPAKRGYESGSGLTRLQTQQVSPVDERRWTDNMKPVRDRWQARAALDDLLPAQREYAVRRAESLGRSYASRVRTCGRHGADVKCGCEAVGVVSSFRPYTCRQHLTCRTCLGQRVKKNAPRIREALEAAWKKAISGGFEQKMYLHLITLTVPHEGGPIAQREKLASGWRALYKRMWKRWRRRWRAWGAGAYVGTYEVTPGRDGLGHVHAHVVIIAPFMDYALLARWWCEATGASHLDLRPSGTDRKPVRSPRDAAHYVSKYVSKGVQADSFTPEMRADVCAAMYNQRQLFSSRKFWQPFDPVCRFCDCKVTVIRRFVFDGAAPFEPGTWKRQVDIPF